MNKIIKITESDISRIVKRVLKEEIYSEEDLKYTHPRTGDKCKIKVALFKPAAERGEMKYHAVLVCPHYGDEMIEAILPVVKSSPEEVSSFICKNIKRTYEILDEMLSSDDEDIFEDYEHQRFKIIDKPINCKLDFY